MKPASALVLAYNQAPYVVEALESLFAQSVPLQVVVCDDCSTDGTAERARAVLDRHGWPNGSKLVVNEKNIGNSRNLALAMSQCDHRHIIVNDADDVSEPTRAQRLLAALDTFGVSLVGTAVRPIDATGQEGAPSFWRVSGDRVIAPEDIDPYGRWTVLGATMAFDRAIWDDFGEFPADIRMPDKALTHRALASRGIMLLDAPLLRYRVTNSSLTRWLTDWSVPRTMLSRKLADYVASNEGLLEDLDTVLGQRPDSPFAPRLREVRRNLARQTELVRAVIDMPGARPLGRLVRTMLSRDAYLRGWAARCFWLSVDPARHEMWTRMSPAEIFTRAGGSVKRKLRGEEVAR